MIRDVYRWPRELVSGLDAGGLRSATGGGGLTVSQSLYLKNVAVEAAAVVYASAEHNTTLHETVHAFSQLVFATTGPTWYSEGMAENGKYWREGQVGAGADPRVIQYLHETTPRKSVAEVLKPFQATGDKRWLAVSDRFEHKAIVDPLAKGEDILPRKHGNTQVPKMIGELARYWAARELTRATLANTSAHPRVVLRINSAKTEEYPKDIAALDGLPVSAIMLAKVSDYYDMDVDYMLRNLATLIEPILLLFLGGMVLFLALGIFLPMWNMMSLFKR